MRGWLGAIVLASSLAVPLKAQQIDWNKAIYEAAKVPAPVKFDYHVEERKLTGEDLFVYQTATTFLDAYSTHHVLARCNGCQEGNPVMKPFVKHGIGATLGISAVYNAVFWRALYTADERNDVALQHELERMIRIQSQMHELAAGHNMSLLDKK